MQIHKAWHFQVFTFQQATTYNKAIEIWMNRAKFTLNTEMCVRARVIYSTPEQATILLQEPIIKLDTSIFGKAQKTTSYLTNDKKF